jgi:hypothetical protein
MCMCINICFYKYIIYGDVYVHNKSFMFKRVYFKYKCCQKLKQVTIILLPSNIYLTFFI